MRDAKKCLLDHLIGKNQYGCVVWRATRGLCIPPAVCTQPGS
jgi:hypothetical protein